MHEVAGSRPVSSTSFFAFIDAIGFTLGGFVAGEGSFITTTGAPLADSSPRARWVFQVSVAQRDRHLLEALRTLLGVGTIYDARRRKPEWQPMSTYLVASRKAHLERVIPFADRFLLPTAKRRQFETWRDSLYEYDAAHPPRQRSVCSIGGCTGLVRGRGLCRSHSYRATGY